GGDHLGVDAELVAESDDLGRGGVRGQVDPPQLEGWHFGNLARPGQRERKRSAARRGKELVTQNPNPRTQDGVQISPVLYETTEGAARNRPDPNNCRWCKLFGYCGL